MFAYIYSIVVLHITAVTSLPQNTCYTQACIEASENILSKMDLTVNPCDDTYNFVCGKHLTNNGSTGLYFEEYQRKLINGRLRSLLERSEMEDDPKSFKHAKTLYKECMQTDEFSDDDLTLTNDILERNGGWPVVKGSLWNDTFNWIDAIQKLRQSGIDTSFYMFLWTVVDDGTSVENLELKKPRVPNNLRSFNEAEYYNYMVDVAVFFGAERAKAEIELRESLQFQMKLESYTQYNIKDDKYTSTQDKIIADAFPTADFEAANLSSRTLKELEYNYPFINFRQYLKILDPTRTFNDNEIINADLKYLAVLNEVVSNTAPRTLANYLSWKTIEQIIPYLKNQLVNLGNQYVRSGSGVTGEEPAPWERCVERTHKCMPLAISALYSKTHLVDTKKAVENLVSEIRTEFANILKKSDWLDDKTRNFALEKLNNIQYYPVYPNELLNFTLLDEYLDEVLRNEQSCLTMYVNNNIWKLKSLQQPLEYLKSKFHWIKEYLGQDIYALNAFYYFHGLNGKQVIRILNGFVHQPAFNINQPNYVNYGAVGAIIGHELSHAFDNKNRKLFPRILFEDWWSQAADEIYESKARCLVEQYGNFTVVEDKTGNRKVNGIHTLSENIPDNSGIQLAYSAYSRFIEEDNEEYQLPGLNYTGKQMFWISFANMYCNNIAPEKLKLVLGDVHAPPRYRVLGSLRNMKEFSYDFQCETGKEMNPINKCSLW